MMTKTQKILAWIFGAMFVVPEILWSPVVNFYYELLQTSKSGGTHPFRYNFLQNSDNLNYLKFVIALQFVGLLLALIFVTKNKFMIIESNLIGEKPLSKCGHSRDNHPFTDENPGTPVKISSEKCRIPGCPCEKYEFGEYKEVKK